MSEITNVILTTAGFEDEGFAEFQRLLFPHGETGLVSCTDERRGRDQRFTEVVWRDPADIAEHDDED